MKHILVAGARPNFMKVAPILRAFSTHAPDEDVLLLHTGQHYSSNMSDSFFEDLGIPPANINLGIGSGSHAEQTARIMVGFEKVCLDEKPDWVLVVGDVNSTVACAITAKKLGIRVAHVEAGLRSRDMSMPEEINRLCTDVIADLLFTTDELADENLRQEGIREERIRRVGNTMIDTLLRHIGQARALPPHPAASGEAYAVLTMHRPSNVDRVEDLARLIEAVNDVAARIPIIFPVHPRTAPQLREVELHRNLRLVEPMSYLPFLALVAGSRMVLTDSGGIQEETTILGIPCLTMRPNTERPITCTIGTNVLVGADPGRIRREAFAVLDGASKPAAVPEMWDGHAAERIVAALCG